MLFNIFPPYISAPSPTTTSHLRGSGNYCVLPIPMLRFGIPACGAKTA